MMNEKMKWPQQHRRRVKSFAKKDSRRLKNIVAATYLFETRNENSANAKERKNISFCNFPQMSLGI